MPEERRWGSRWLLNAFVGIALAALLAAPAWARTPLSNTEETTTWCAGVAPTVAWCDLGSHTSWRYFSALLHVWRDYTGTLGWVVAHPAGQYQHWCHIQDGAPLENCITTGLRPLPGVPYRVGCLSLDLRSDDPGGVGSWRCTFNSV